MSSSGEYSDDNSSVLESSQRDQIDESSNLNIGKDESKSRQDSRERQDTLTAKKETAADNFGTEQPFNTIHQQDSYIKKRATSFAEPRHQIQLTWKNISISASPKKPFCRKMPDDAKYTTILEDLSGTVKPGQFLSILGASGAGKTTLLNYLSDRDPSKNLQKEGQILINGVDRDKVSISKYVAYVQQDDVLMQTLTVRECFMFAANLRLPPTVDREERVDKLIESLKLEKAQHTKIGGPLVKGVSGGERKRTSIGVELITEPSIIFLDEPTTGLDSFTAFSVVEVLRSLAHSGRTIISTIHQPNSETFETFDQLMLLADGRVLYHNDAKRAVDYFSSIGYKCPEHTNPADYFMYMMSIEAYEIDDADQDELQRRKTEIEHEYKNKIHQMHDKYEASELKNDPESEHPEAQPLGEDGGKGYKASFVKQFCLLAQRSFKNTLRLPAELVNKLAIPICIAIMIILVFGRLGDGASSIQSRNGVIFFIAICSVFIPVQTVIVIFPDEKPVFHREHSGGMYSSMSYFLARIIADMPNVILFATFTVLLYYFIVGLNLANAGIFFIHFFYVMLLSFSANGLGYFFSVMVPQKDLAVNLTPVVIIPFMLVGGFFVNQNNFIPVLYPLEYLSLFKYSFQVLVMNEYTDLDLDCQPG